jgi:hypothetical protein
MPVFQAYSRCGAGNPVPNVFPESTLRLSGFHSPNSASVTAKSPAESSDPTQREGHEASADVPSAWTIPL